MAKIQQYSKRAEIRKNKILGCQTCKGNPETAETHLQGIRCTYCVTCMEVINYNNENEKVKTSENVASAISAETKYKNNPTEDNQFEFLKSLRP